MCAFSISKTFSMLTLSLYSIPSLLYVNTFFILNTFSIQTLSFWLPYLSNPCLFAKESLGKQEEPMLNQGLTTLGLPNQYSATILRPVDDDDFFFINIM